MNKTRSATNWFKAVVGVGVVIICSVVFATLVTDIWWGNTISWDVPLMLTIHQYGQPWLDTLMLSLTQLGSLGAIGTAIIVSVWLWRHQRRLDALTLSTSLIGAEALDALIKIVLARPRPLIFQPFVIEHTYSFPSGHTLAAMAVYGLLAIGLWNGHRRFWSVVCGTLPFLVAVSRIYLGVHYPSDVLGALSLGVLWLMALLAVRRWQALRGLLPHPPNFSQ